jgi:hypothetical protein
LVGTLAMLWLLPLTAGRAEDFATDFAIRRLDADA